MTNGAGKGGVHEYFGGGLEYFWVPKQGGESGEKFKSPKGGGAGNLSIFWSH